MLNNFTLNHLDDCLLNQAIEEDLSLGHIDLTGRVLFPSLKEPAEATLYSKHRGSVIVSGLCLIEPLFSKLQAPCQLIYHAHDGDALACGEPIVTIRSDIQALVSLERTLLNFIRHLSGIATLTSHFVKAVANTDTKILDTRKTTPGFRHLEKYAVRCGGGMNHRMGLYDAMMIKDTHVDYIGGMEPTLTRLLTHQSFQGRVIVEVRNREELETVIAMGRSVVNQVLLDNMPLDLLKICVFLAKPYFSTEASGTITLETIKAIAETGVDYASVGCITHSAPQVDLSMTMEG